MSDQVCIDDLLGDKARACGCRCPCPRHTPPLSPEEKANLESSALERQPEQSETAHPARPNGKMAAAHDIEDNE